MSTSQIRAALETALATVTPNLPTEYENVNFEPPASGAYQRTHLMPGDPVNDTFGDDQKREQGIFQVLLYYPTGTGPGAATAQAELIKTKFKRGSTFTNGGISVTISNTPTIAPALFSDDRYLIPIRIRYWAYV
jgi:hypothetical protein